MFAADNSHPDQLYYGHALNPAHDLFLTVRGRRRAEVDAMNPPTILTSLALAPLNTRIAFLLELARRLHQYGTAAPRLEDPLSDRATRRRQAEEPRVTRNRPTRRADELDVPEFMPRR